MKMTKHKHAELIHAWADGAEIQYRNDRNGQTWSNCRVNSPIWSEYEEYRIKPAYTSRDMAIAIAVRTACMFGRYTIPGEEGIDLAAIIDTVKG
jgi:hypothetical protein